MKIYSNESPATIARSGRPWSVVRSLIDPAFVVGTYLGILAIARKPLAEEDLVVILLAMLLTYPGRVPFNRFSAHIALAILQQWFWVLIVLLLYRWVSNAMGLLGAKQLVAPIFSAWAAATPLVLLGIHWLSPALAPYLRCFYKQSRVVIIGANAVGRRFFELIRRGEADGQNVIGFFDDRDAHRLNLSSPDLLKGRIDEVSEYVKFHGIDAIYIALPMSSHRRVVALLEQLRDTTASIYFIPDIYVADLIQGHVDTVGGLPLLSVCDTPLQGMSGTIKRALDLTLTLLALPILLPVFALVALLIRLTSPGPVIFKQRRYGLDGRKILVWKFRTMKTLEDGDKTYRQVTREDDRVTPLGKLLRKTSLDELPQLFNVLAGTMSLVGPRPHTLAVNEQFRKLIPGYMVRHKVRPGITGWAQVNGCRGGDDLESMRKRTAYDLEYLRSWCLTLDLVIIWKTAWLLIVGDKRAY
jgi:putative colanic acid biosynthesis UDP-glucose lipid carrier transferase